MSDAPVERPRPFRVGLLVHDVSRLRSQVVDRALRPFGITRSQWWLLTNLEAHDGGSMTQTEIAQLLSIGKVALGELLDRLEAVGAIRRRADGPDRRSKRIEVTPVGSRLLHDIRDIALRLNDTMIGDIPVEDLRVLEEVLVALKARLAAR